MITGLRYSSNILTPYTIVLASAGSSKALAVAQSLKVFGAKVLGVSNYALNPYRFSRLFDYVVILNKMNRESPPWAIHVAEAASTYGADLVIPIDFVDVVTFSSCQKIFDKYGVKLAAPKINVLLKVSKKVMLEELVGDLVPTPRSLFCASPNEINLEIIKSLRPPLVVKGISDRSLPEYFSSYELAVERTKERAPCLIQEYIAGKGRGYYAVAFDGEVLIEFAHERIYEADPSGGGSIAAKGPILDPRLFKLGREIVQRLKWTGPIMVETKWVQTTGEYYLLELNPKFWGSLALPVSLGYHFPVVLAIAYLKGLDAAREFCKHLLVQKSGEYYFLLDGSYYIFRIPEVWLNMLIRSRIVKSDVNLLDPARVTIHLGGAILQGIKSRKKWSSNLALLLSRLKSTFKKLQKAVSGVIFDLDGVLVDLKIPWLAVKNVLYSKRLLYKWENIRECLVRLWKEDKSLYKIASLTIEEFERKYLHDVKIIANIARLNSIKREYGVTYYLVTFQSESIAKDITRRIGLHVDMVLGRDSGFGPLKEDLYRKCLESKHYTNDKKFIVFDDELANLVNALRIGCLPIWVIKSKYHKINSLHLEIPYTDPQQLHNAILSLLKGA